MLLLGLMATRTGQRGVVRHRLGPGDLAVARAAVLRCVRGSGAWGLWQLIQGFSGLCVTGSICGNQSGAMDCSRGTKGKRRAAWGR